MGNRKIALPLAVFAALAAVVVPLPSRAAITVAPPTGDADPALLAELQTWLKMIAEEQGSAVKVDGVLRIDAEPSGEGVALTLELTPSDGTAPYRESRVVSRASAAPNARAMARAAIRTVAPPPTVVATQASDAPKTAPPPQPVRLVLNSPYDQRRAYWISVGPTLGGIVFGGALVGLAFAIENDSGRVATLGVGATIAGLAFLVGPSLGHFYVRNNLQGSLTLVFRTLLSGGATAFFFGAALVTAFSGPCSGFGLCEGDSVEEEENQGDDGGSAFGGYLAGGIITAAGALTLAIVDLATVQRAAQRANEKAAAEKETDAKISGVAFAPLVVPGPNGTTTTGLAFSMRY